MEKVISGETFDHEEPLHALSPGRIKLSKQLFSFIASSLNKLHGTDLSERFWMLVSEEYSRSVILRYQEFISAPLSDRPPFLPQMTGQPLNFKSRLRGELSAVKNYLRSRNARKRLFSRLQNHHQILIDFDEHSLIAGETGGVPLPTCSLKPEFMGDGKKRDVLNKMADYETGYFKKNVLRQMPAFLVEHFTSIYESIPLSSPKQKSFHVRGKLQFSYRQFVMAKYAEKGANLICYQNGAMVAECNYKYGGYLVRTIADVHRTWGWTMTEVDEPWRAYDLEEFRVQYEQAEKLNRDDLLITFPKLWNSEAFYLDIAQRLLSVLPRDRYTSIRIRPYPSWKSGSGAEKFQALDDTRLTISNFEESMAQEIANSRLVLHIDVPATAFLESLSVNHPSMGFLNNEYPTDMIKSYYEWFLENGVLHTDLTSLSDQLNHSNIDQWWEEVSSENIYKTFKSKFTGAAAKEE